MDAVGFAARGHQGGGLYHRDRRRRRKHDARALRDAQRRKPRSRANAVFDTTIGWRFVNPAMEAYGIDSMPETADNVAEDFNISRADQDAFAAAQPGPLGKGRRRPGRFADEIAPVTVPQRKGDPVTVETVMNIPAPDTRPRKLGKLRGINGPDSR
jgi:acetyl-CoA acetyltransferase